MSNSSFFDESKEQSLVKAEIVAKYFWAWAKVIIPQAKKMGCNIAYIDLFSGPGRYKDGSKSTPLLILERAIADPEMREMLMTIFNDRDSNNTNSLQRAISSLPTIDKLRHQPIILNKEVGEEFVQIFEHLKLIPTLFFIDPWGYKGLSIRLIGSSIMNWGCDCIFFFNYNRINMGFSNKLITKHMNALFGEERADALQKKLKPMSISERELTIVDAISEALKEIGGKYVLPFSFKKDKPLRTSHHLIFVSKNARGYGIMKDIMARASTSSDQGVPSFEYNPVTRYRPLLFEISRPLDELENMLLDEFAGETLTMEEVYNRHHVGKRYISKNYKDVLLRLEQQGKIIADPPAPPRKKNTFADKVRVIFPSK